MRSNRWTRLRPSFHHQARCPAKSPAPGSAPWQAAGPRPRQTVVAFAPFGLCRRLARCRAMAASPSARTGRTAPAASFEMVTWRSRRSSWRVSRSSRRPKAASIRSELSGDRKDDERRLDDERLRHALAVGIVGELHGPNPAAGGMCAWSASDYLKDRCRHRDPSPPDAPRCIPAGAKHWHAAPHRQAHRRQNANSGPAGFARVRSLHARAVRARAGCRHWLDRRTGWSGFARTRSLTAEHLAGSGRLLQSSAGRCPTAS